MKKNMGNADRLIRVALAALITTLFVTKFLSGTFGIILFVLAGIFLIAGMVGYCPLFAAFGITSAIRKSNFKGSD